MSARALPELESPVSADEFQALEEKVYKTIELLKSAREGKAIAERDLSRLREQLEDREEEVETMRQQIVSLRREREDVRGRVEKMLKQIDALSVEAVTTSQIEGEVLDRASVQSSIRKQLGFAADKRAHQAG